MTNRNNYKNRKNRRAPKDKSNETRDTRRKDSTKEKYTAESPRNNPDWYSQFPQLVKDTSSLFFSNPLGVGVKRVEYSGSPVYSGLDHVPGIITLNAIPTPGYSPDATSPVNALARAIYSFIRHANSGHSNYDSPDLMMYLLAMDSNYSLWATMVRAYGVARYFSIRNRYLANQWLTAFGFNAANIQDNLAQFRAMINTYATKLGSFAVPSSMNFFRRHTEMYTQVFLDEPSEKAQAYAFKLSHLWRLDTTGGTGTQLVPQSIASPVGLTQLKALISALFDPILADEDMNIMSGDVLKAFGSEGIFKVPLIPEEYVTPFTFDMVVLSQIENSMATNFIANDIITQDPTTGAILYAPTFGTTTNRLFALSKILNLHHNDPSAMDIMEATRLMYNVDPSDTAAHLTGFGSELVVSYDMYNFLSDGTFTATLQMPFPAYDSTTQFGDANLTGTLVAISNMSSFNYHPRMTLWNKAVGSGGTIVRTLVMDIFDLDNYTSISDETLSSISEVAMLSMFDVGRIALAQG